MSGCAFISFTHRASFIIASCDIAWHACIFRVSEADIAGLDGIGASDGMVLGGIGACGVGLDGGDDCGGMGFDCCIGSGWVTCASAGAPADVATAIAAPIHGAIFIALSYYSFLL